MNEKVKNIFFANMSHELRTPLNIILSVLQLLMHDNNGSDTAEKNSLYRYFFIMKQNSFRLLRLVNNIIDVTKIDSSFFDIHMQNHNIVAVIEDITQSVTQYTETKGIRLLFDTDVEDRMIACDPDLIERVMLNLLSNAIKFTKSGGEINVRIQDQGPVIEISVEDNGIGIPEDQQQVIFERFKQSTTLETRENEGSGIGLSLVKSLVEMHGGEIQLNSTYGKGSIFTFFLPVRLTEEGSKVEPLNEDKEQRHIEKLNIEFSDLY